MFQGRWYVVPTNQVCTHSRRMWCAAVRLSTRRDRLSGPRSRRSQSHSPQLHPSFPRLQCCTVCINRRHGWHCFVLRAGKSWDRGRAETRVVGAHELTSDAPFPSRLRETGQMGCFRPCAPPPLTCTDRSPRQAVPRPVSARYVSGRWHGWLPVYPSLALVTSRLVLAHRCRQCRVIGSALGARTGCVDLRGA